MVSKGVASVGTMAVALDCRDCSPWQVEAAAARQLLQSARSRSWKCCICKLVVQAPHTCVQVSPKVVAIW